ncbi:MAG: hypothetical protein IPL25_19075 [Saprospiraceae bacterium]|nr:hypothetical protein [Candidatus Vicinibacter affinis]
MNIFDFAQFDYKANEDILTITFLQDEFKYTNSLYFTEKEYYLDQIQKYFGHNEIGNDKYLAWRTNFINNHNFESQHYKNEELQVVYGMMKHILIHC